VRVDNVTQFATQLLNGLQLGVALFLMSAGLTLVLGIMNFVNLAHGSFFMIAAYIAATTYKYTQSFLLSGLAAVAGAFAVGVAVDIICLRRLYDRDHLAQVLATFGLTLFFNEAVRIIWGPAGIFAAVPPFLAGQVTVAPGLIYPVYRLVVLAVGVVTGIGLYGVIVKTRAGMIVRAGGSDRMMTAAMGVNIRTLSAAVFGAGAALAGLAGFMAAPMVAVQSGMGDPILILTLVVIVIGGIGSVRGAVLASLVVGIVDTLGRVYIPIAIGSTLPRAVSDALSPALTSMLIYLIMTAILIFKPRGLLPASTG
jgi:branched-chain amino acid transport system permease protein